MKKLHLVFFMCCVTGCIPLQNKQQQGTLIGATGGGILGAAIGQAVGHDTNSTLIGGFSGLILGAATGSYIGAYMDEADRLAIRNTLEYNRTNTPSVWASKDPKIQTIQAIPTRTYGNCRDMTLNVRKSDNTFATEQRRACRENNGSWRLDNGYSI
jgi:surface antigen